MTIQSSIKQIDLLKDKILSYLFVDGITENKYKYVIEFSEWQGYNGTQLDGISVSKEKGKINALKLAIDALNRINMQNSIS